MTPVLGLLRLVPAPFWLVGIAVVALGAAYLKGSADTAARIELRIEREVAAERERQRVAIEAVQAEADRQADARAIEIDTLTAQVNAFRDQLASQPADAACALTEHDAEALNALVR